MTHHTQLSKYKNGTAWYLERLTKPCRRKTGVTDQYDWLISWPKTSATLHYWHAQTSANRSFTKHGPQITLYISIYLPKIKTSVRITGAKSQLYNSMIVTFKWTHGPILPLNTKWSEPLNITPLDICNLPESAWNIALNKRISMLLTIQWLT
jgi:hypothetical protein